MEYTVTINIRNTQFKLSDYTCNIKHYAENKFADEETVFRYGDGCEYNK
jgi:hypothetical protein